MNYKLAEIYYGSETGKDITKPWYVYYFFKDPVTGVFERFREKKGINRYHTVSERTREAVKLRDAINADLKAGWSPYAKYQGIETIDIITGIDQALEVKKIYKAKKTWLGYRSRMKFVKEAIKELGYQDLNLSEVKRQHVKEILNHMASSGISKHKYNTCLEVFRTMFSQLVDDGKMESNPALGIKTEPLPESEGFRSYQALLTQIKEMTYGHSFEFGLIYEIGYMTGIRPNEILGMQWERLDFEKYCFTLLPEVLIEGKELPEKILKTLTIRHVWSTAELFEKIKKHYKNCCKRSGLKELPPKWFVFSQRNTFFSGPTRLHRNRTTDVFRQLRQEAKLPESVKMYGYKHTRTDDLIDAGVPLEYIKEQYGHHSTVITRAYGKKMREKSAQVIKELGPKY